MEGFLTPIDFFTNIDAAYIIKITLKLQTHNPGEYLNGIGPVDFANPGSDKKESTELTLMVQFPNNSEYQTRILMEYKNLIYQTHVNAFIAFVWNVMLKYVHLSM